jgi:hypothetical protein
LGYVLLGLIIAFIPFVLPILGWVSARRTRNRLAALERVVVQQADEIDRLISRLRVVETAAARPPAPETRQAAARDPVPAESAPSEPAPVEARPSEPPVQEPAVEEAPASIPAVVPPLVSAAAAPSEPLVEAPREEPAQIAAQGAAEPAAAPPLGDAAAAGSVPPPKPPTPPPSAPAFDWESLIGVKLFAGIAGIALVLAAVFFLRYSIDQGWLQPPVRVGIGLLVAVALLVLCELKAAREYPATANALDGAAIAILFSTFFAAHSLWNLIPASATFVLLAIVTALAVLLSIRRESLFIAVLGLLGGFATPALVSTGENRPIPLFGYLLLLNVGLAWVAYRKVWPVLTWLTLALTTLYQAVWVARFLDESSLSLAMGIFLIFPLAAAAALTLAGPRSQGKGDRDARSFERTAMLSAGVPLIFAAYLASAPAYGAHAGLLLGFLLIVDAGLMAIAIARGQPLLHATGGISTLVVLAVWLATSYVTGEGWTAALVCTPGFVLLYLAALPLARRFGRPLGKSPVRAAIAAPLVLFVFPVLAAIEPAFVRPLLMFATLLVLVTIIAWRTAVESAGTLYFVASFFAIATQAVWSGAYLTEDRLRVAVLIYTIFGLVSMAAPVLARRTGREFRPKWGSGVVLLASLALLAFVSLGPVSAAALWALALLLAIMNAALFIESASGGLPRISQVGTLLSWGLLALWWPRAAGSVGVLPSLIVMSGLTLITLAGHAWAARRAAGDDRASAFTARFSQGLYLSLVGHFFLLLIAANREWSLPPWPIFGALVVMTLGSSAASLFTRTPSLHAGGAIGAALVVSNWASAAGAPEWGMTVVLAVAVVSAYALAWIPLGGSTAAIGGLVVLFVGELAVLSGTEAGARPPFAAQLLIHMAQLSAILFLTARHRWRFVAVAAVVPAWMAVVQWLFPASSDWRLPLLLAAALYAIFIAYPLVLGARARGDRDPYLAAVFASAMFFFNGRRAFELGGLGWAVGAVPLAVAAVLALLLRGLLRLEPPGERDIGRLALVAGAALAFVTVAIPLQLHHQWITIGWALEGAALAWLYCRIPHRGLFYGSTALLLAVFVRLAVNPEVLHYEPRGDLRILNWYLYTYLICAAAMFVAARWLATMPDRLFDGIPRVSALLPGAGVILLFLLLNIEIADFYSTGPTIVFEFGATLSQDLTYTIGWLAFGLLLLVAGIYTKSRAARITAVSLIAITTLKCFVYDLRSLRGLYLVASLTGLALSLVLVSIALKKYVLSKPKDGS